MFLRLHLNVDEAARFKVASAFINHEVNVKVATLLVQCGCEHLWLEKKSVRTQHDVSDAKSVPSVAF